MGNKLPILQDLYQSHFKNAFGAMLVLVLAQACLGVNRFDLVTDSHFFRRIGITSSVLAIPRRSLHILGWQAGWGRVFAQKARLGAKFAQNGEKKHKNGFTSPPR